MLLFKACNILLIVVDYVIIISNGRLFVKGIFDHLEFQIQIKIFPSFAKGILNDFQCLLNLTKR